MNEPRLTIHLDPFKNQLQQELMTDLTSLRIVLKAIEDDTYKSLEVYSSGNQFVHWAINPLPDPEALCARETSKCLKAVVGSLQDYMDRLIATIKFCKEGKITPLVATGTTTLEKAILKRFSEILRGVSEDKTLAVTKKLDLLLAHDPMREVVQNYFDLRNGLEHHKGIAKADRLTTFKRMWFTTGSGKDIREIIGPGILNDGEGLDVRIVDEQLSFKEGDVITLSSPQLENIVFTILLHVVPKMTEAVMNTTNGT